MSETLQPLLAWIAAHPAGALAALFALALIDSILIVGIFVPTALPLFALGALVALGALDLQPAVLVTAAGALSGDILSFWLGRRYGERLFAARFFTRHPEMLERSRAFFARRGAFSIFLARFLGPMRSITPALAAASGMRFWVFLATDIPAALLWALAYILPGVAFGASLGLAAEVAGRLAMLLLVLLLGLVLLVWLIGIARELIARRGGRWLGRLLAWSRRHHRLGRIGVALLDEDLPETRALAVLALLLFVAAALALVLVAGRGLHDYPLVLDASLVQWLQGLHTPWGIALARHLLELGSAALYVPLAAVTLIGLFLQRGQRAAAHWVGALGFGALIALGLYLVPLLPPPGRYFEHGFTATRHGRDFILATVTYSFLPVLLATGRAPNHRRLLYSIAGVLLGLTLFAQLYLGVQWPSVALLLLGFGLLWSALLGVGYRHHRPQTLRGRVLLPLLGLTAMLALGLRWNALPETQPLPAPPPRTLELAVWREQGDQDLPDQRQDVTGRPRQPLQLQWAGPLDAITAQLRHAGWEDTLSGDPALALRWLSREATIAELPVLPRVHAGQHPALSLRRGVGDTRQYLLRLWPTPVRLSDGRPLWIGSIVLQEIRPVYRLLRYPIAIDAAPPLALLPEPLPRARQLGDWWLLESPPP